MSTTELITIAQGKEFDRSLLQHIVIKDRIESLLEDMNLEPLQMHGELHIGDAKRRENIFHASEIGSLTGKTLDGNYPMGCGRALYYGYTGASIERSFDPRLRRIFDTGSAIHLQLQLYLAAYAKKHKKTEKFEDEVKICPENNPMADKYDISAHMDGLYEVNTPVSHIRAGVEIKTINTDGFKGTSSPHAEHMIQGTVYQACLDLPVMIFLYYNKNDSSLAEYVMEFDDHRWCAIIDKLDYVRDCAMSKKEPKQEIGFGCKNCKYAKICKPPGKTRSPLASTVFRSNKRKED
ncbi:hypothetical protein UFOVP276_102 [uncultured Caudovirales phage]|uniref:COG1468 CRISPR-associated protein Cas4 (RecB family exonuclease) n=1 Tax=uncultured Caudovirales phage TaxID=2100421 RepID=A0A6J5LQF4_9CAUD|nr:hypothetical protein UFOVP127_239 [uncultured Caudovirales phage]CAB4135146.1 hypothetical protein UFOVP276_102 [uncultured Caudovirales phage]